MKVKVTYIDEIWLQDIALQLGRYILAKKRETGEIDQKLYDIFLALTEVLSVEDNEDDVNYGEPEI